MYYKNANYDYTKMQLTKDNQLFIDHLTSDTNHEVDIPINNSDSIIDVKIMNDHLFTLI